MKYLHAIFCLSALIAGIAQADEGLYNYEYTYEHHEVAGQLVEEIRWTHINYYEAGNIYLVSKEVKTWSGTNEFVDVTSFKQNGSVSEHYTTLNSQKHGLHQVFGGDSGEETFSGRYKNGLREGVHRTSEYYNSYGHHTLYLKDSSSYRNGLLDGRYEGQGCTSNGVPYVSVQGQYTAGEKSGLWTQYTSEGKRHKEESWANGLRNGETTEYNDNSRPFIVETYVDDVLNGPYEVYYTNSQLNVTGTYKDGSNEIGTWTYYDRTGRITQRDTYDQQSVRIKSEIYVWDDDSSNPTAASTPLATGIFTGSGKTGEPWSANVQNYYESGQIKYAYQGTVTTWRVNRGEYGGIWVDAWDGLKNWNQYFDGSGTKWTLTPYVNGKKHGVEIFRDSGKRRTYENGRPVSETGTGSYGDYVVGMDRDVLRGDVWHGSYLAGNGSTIVEKGQYSAGVQYGVWSWTLGASSGSHDYGSPVAFQRAPNGDESPEGPPDVPPDTRTVRVYGKVTSGGKGVSSVDITMEDGETTLSTFANGGYEIWVEPNQTIDIQVEHADYLKYSSSFSVGDTQSRLMNISLIRRPPAKEAGVTSVHSKYGKASGQNEYFISGVNFINPYTMNANWNGEEPGTVGITIDGSTTALTATDGAYKHFLQAGDLMGTDEGTVHNFAVTAWNRDGKASKSVKWNPVVYSKPSWVGDLTVSATGNRAVYQTETVIPEAPFSIEVSQAAVVGIAGGVVGDNLWALWGEVPLVGGEEFGIKPTQARTFFWMRPDGTGKTGFRGMTGFNAFGKTLEGDLSGRGSLRFVQGEGLGFTDGNLRMEIRGSLSRSENIGKLVPGLNAMTNRWFVGKVARAFANLGEVSATISPAVNINMDVGTDENGDIELTSDGSLDGSIELALSGGLGSDLTATVSGKGTARLFYELPSDYGITGFDFTMTPKVAYTAFSYSDEFEESFTWGFGSGAQHAPMAMAAAPMITDTGFHPIRTTFTGRADYDCFIERPQAAPLAEGAAPLAAPVSDTPLISNVYPQAKPVIASHGDTNVIAYVYYNPAQDIVRGTDIAIMTDTGSGWTAPTRINEDTRAEFSPNIAFDENGMLIAAWSRVQTNDFPLNGTLGDMVAELETVYAFYDFSDTSPAWSAPVALTTNNVVDHAPILARDANGSVTLCWQQNAGNQLVGDATYPTTVMTADWNASTKTFSAPQVVGNSFAAAQQFHFAHRGAESRLVWSQNTSEDLLTVTDTEIHQMIATNGVWGTPQALTANSLSDTAPRLHYPTTGDCELFWVQTDTNSPASIERMIDWATQASTSIVEQAMTPGFADFRLVPDSEGNLGLIWQAAGPDLFTSIFDYDQSTWSEVIRLTETAGREDHAEWAFDADNDLLGVFALWDDADNTKDLWAISRPMVHDLAVTSFEKDPADPRPGSNVTFNVTVENSGMFARGGALVEFFAGDSSIGTTNLSPNPFPGGAVTNVAFSWNVPVDYTNAPISAAVSSSDGEMEADISNDSLSLMLFELDLVAEQCRLEIVGDGTLEMAATVLNNSEYNISDVRVDFIDQHNGVLGTQTLPTLLARTEADISCVVVESGFDYSNVVVKAIVDINNTVPEVDEDNNDVLLPVLTAKDLDADGLPDSWERVYIETNDTDNVISLISISPAGDLDEDDADNTAEYIAGTDPLTADTDGDGLPDGWELEYGLDPLSAADAALNSDTDSLTNLEEYTHGSDPTTGDSDGDGLDDDDEVNTHGTNPADEDTDDDGLTDGAELNTHNTDPDDPDTDRDGMPDGWEVAHSLDPEVDDANADADGDLLSNGDEYAQQSDPGDTDSDDDGLTDAEEHTNGTDPNRTDTDWDQVSDSMEVQHGFDPLDESVFPTLQIAGSLGSGSELSTYSNRVQALYASGSALWSFDQATYTQTAAVGTVWERLSMRGSSIGTNALTHVDLPFSFPLYGEFYDECWISIDGCVQFGTNGNVTAISGADLGSIPAVLALWDDQAGTVYTNGSSDSMMIRWDTVYTNKWPDADGTPVEVAVTLHNNGAIDFCYGEGNTIGGTVGISGEAGRLMLLPESYQTNLNAAQRFRLSPHGAAPLGIEIDPSGNLTGIPREFGNFDVAVRVTDQSRTVTSNLTLTISANLNAKPVLNSVSPTNSTDSVGEANPISLTVNATDPEAGSLTYAWLVDGAMASTGASASYAYTPAWGDAGSHRVECLVSDDTWKDYLYHSWTLTVLSDNDSDGLPNSYELLYSALDPNTADASADPDGDTLTNVQEHGLGTHPGEIDTDDDTMRDDWEITYSFDPLVDDGDDDADSDNLSNAGEYARGTNPRLTDSDSDTLSDGDEVHTHGTNPAKADTDDDTMRDDWELSNTLLPLVDDGGDDPDRDLLLNKEEYAAGTDPHVADTDEDGLADGWEAAQSDPVVALPDRGAVALNRVGLWSNTVAASERYASSLAVDGDRLYIGESNEQGTYLTVLDITQPFQPAYLGTLLLFSQEWAPPVSDIAVQGNRACVILPYTGAFFVDVSNPANMQVESSLIPSDPDSYPFEAIEYDGASTAYVMAATNWYSSYDLLKVDLSIATNPVTSLMQSNLESGFMALSGNYLVVPTPENGVITLDRLTGLGVATNSQLSGFDILAEGSNAVLWVQDSNGRRVSVLDTSALPVVSERVEMEYSNLDGLSGLTDRYLYSIETDSEWNEWLVCYDIQNPAAPQKLTALMNEEGSYDFRSSAAVGAILYIPADGGIVILQLSLGDIDEDGMDDSWEEQHFSSTSRDGTGDYDNDGLSDLLEALIGSDPQNPDSDGDGIPDGWEYHTGLLNLSTNDEASDRDGDGYNALAEFISGSDPLQSGSVFRFSPQPALAGKIGLQWDSLPGRIYSFGQSSNLVDWAAVPGQPDVPGTGESLSVDLDQTGPVRYYRLNVRMNE